MAPRKYKVKFVDGKACVEKNQPVDESNELECELKGKIERNGTSLKFIPNSIDQNFDVFFQTFVDKITGLRLTQKDTDIVFSLSEELLVQTISMCRRFCDKEDVQNETFIDVLSTAECYGLKKLSTVKSTYKRKKNLNKNEYYVAPVEKAMGLKWITKITPELDLLNHQLVQTTFQVVPPSKTLEALFRNDKFKQNFIEYNQLKRLNGCVAGTFDDYCCGNVSRNSDVFRSDHSIVLQFGIDEFDPCDGLKTKATIHKIFAVYMQIKNIPPEYAARLNNIFLVALCPSSNFKETGCCDDNVIEEIVRDLKSLEDNGIDIGNNERLKVGLFNICCDNLGANVLFGFAGGFNARQFCRFCECTKDKTQTMVEADISKLRTVASYQSQINKLELNSNLDLKETDGIRKNCLFNELDSFHVCQNLSVDIMHDILEGSVPYFLHQLFNYCTREKICTENDIIRRVRDFNYGTLNTRNKPSRISIDRKNLGQNATQSYCIIMHLPFIFLDKKDALHVIWPILISLLECIRISFSYKLNDSDRKVLKQCVKDHLSGMRDIFKIPLKPKHHNMTHLPHTIGEMGPVRRNWMMSHEMKHKFFTTVAKKSMNYINIAKTLAEAHQAYICTNIEFEKTFSLKRR